MKYVLLFALLSLISTQLFARDYTPAKITKNNNSKKPKTTSNFSKREGWIILDYIIDEKGKTRNYLVLDGNDEEKYLERTIERIQNYSFTPAMLDGNSVPTHSYYKMRYGKTFYNNPNDGISRAFNRRYKDISNLLGENKLEDAKVELEELREDYAKNLTEQALSAWIHALYYYSVKDWFSYRDYTQIGFHLKEYLSTDIALQNTKNLLQWQVYKKDYSGAAYTLNQLNEMEGINFTEGAYEKTKQDITAAYNKEPLIQIHSQLSEGKAWVHELTGSKLSVKVHNGKINQMELRCYDSWHKFETFEFEDFAAPSQESKCFLFIKGEHGTQFSYQEKDKYPELLF